MGLDVGEKTIGVAVSDLLGLTAQGVEVIARKNLHQDLKRILDMVAHYHVQKIVIGLPRSLNNTLGQQAEKVEQFAGELGRRTGVSIEFIDERFTTTIAQRSLLEADVSRSKRKQVVDKLAAQIILQSYLDRMRHVRKGQTTDADRGEVDY